jgi:hypothetical protein
MSQVIGAGVNRLYTLIAYHVFPDAPVDCLGRTNKPTRIFKSVTARSDMAPAARYLPVYLARRELSLLT